MYQIYLGSEVLSTQFTLAAALEVAASAAVSADAIAAGEPISIVTVSHGRRFVLELSEVTDADMSSRDGLECSELSGNSEGEA